jgi:hypothetical protein
MGFFGRKRDMEQQAPAEVYAGLRQQVLGLTLINSAMARSRMRRSSLC